MPTEAWANEGPDQYNFDMEPDGNYKLKVVINRECNAIEAGNSHANGRALKTSGYTELAGNIWTTVGSHSTLRINDVNNGDDDAVALDTINLSDNGDARALRVSGQAEIELMPDNLGGDAQTALKVDATEGVEDNLAINAVGRSEFSIPAFVHANPVTLFNVDGSNLGGGNDRALVVEGKTDLNGDVEVDANLAVTGDASVGDDLTVTDDASIGGDLTVTGAADVDGALAVGPSNNVGLIDSGGSAITTRALKIGSQNVTAHLELSRSGQYAKMQGDLVVNGKSLILDSAISLGFGFLYNSVGHGAGGASIDVYIAGNVVGYWDSLGWH
jgi:hypothetical protein